MTIGNDDGHDAERMVRDGKGDGDDGPVMNTEDDGDGNHGDGNDGEDGGGDRDADSDRDGDEPLRSHQTASSRGTKEPGEGRPQREPDRRTSTLAPPFWA